jgi:hypothetical protein
MSSTMAEAAMAERDRANRQSTFSSRSGAPEMRFEAVESS